METLLRNFKDKFLIIITGPIYPLKKFFLSSFSFGSFSLYINESHPKEKIMLLWGMLFNFIFFLFVSPF